MGFLCILIYCFGRYPVEFHSLSGGFVLGSPELWNCLLFMSSVENGAWLPFWHAFVLVRLVVLFEGGLSIIDDLDLRYFLEFPFSYQFALQASPSSSISIIGGTNQIGLRLIIFLLDELTLSDFLRIFLWAYLLLVKRILILLPFFQLLAWLPEVLILL